VEAWSRRDPKNQSVGLSDSDARVGRGKKRRFFLGYKVHYACDWNSEFPTAYTLRPANENEKPHFKALASAAKGRFRNAEWHIADTQYTSRELRRFVEEDLRGAPVIPKRSNERIGEGDFYVDRAFRSHGNPMLCKLYRRRTACERMNSRAERLVGTNTLRGLGKVKAYTGMALVLILLIGVSSQKRGKPWLARSIEYYADC
jgi:hypothetical protein